MNKSSQIPYRIRLGVTGHRALNNVPEITACVQQILDSRYLEAFTPEAVDKISNLKSTQIVFSVFSPLAEGADRLVANTVLKHGGYLEAMLPMPRDEYEKDFVTPRSRGEFADLLEQAHRITVTDLNVSSTDSDYRNKAYQHVGEETVSRSDILIALWDGKPSRGLGGTAEIVEFAISKKKPLFIVSTSELGRIDVINSEILNADFVSEIESFNDRAVDILENIDDEIEEAKKELFPSILTTNITDHLMQVIQERLLPTYCLADNFAKKFQASFRYTGKTGYRYSTLSVFFMAAGVVAGTLATSITSYIIELALLGFLVLLIHKAEKNRVHPGWLEHRALAERLRIAIYFTVCGEFPNTIDGYRTIHRHEQTWVEYAYNEIIYSLPEIKRSPLVPLERYVEFIKDSWLRGQINHHFDKTDRQREKNHRFRNYALNSFKLAIAISVLHMIFTIIGANYHHEEGLILVLVEKYLSIFAITLPALGAALTGYRSLMEYSRISARSKGMAYHLSRLYEQTDIQDSNAFRHYLERIEDTMLLESEDWLALMEHAELEKIA